MIIAMCLGNLFISTISFKPIYVVVDSISKVAKVTKLNESKPLVALAF
jgi:hypothetical protein